MSRLFIGFRDLSFNFPIHDMALAILYVHAGIRSKHRILCAPPSCLSWAPEESTQLTLLAQRLGERQKFFATPSKDFKFLLEGESICK